MVRILLFGGLAFAILLGLLQSFDVVFHLWGADSDSADPVNFWHGIHEHGYEFIKQWRYTPDNWLLSLLPFDCLVFSIFGDSPVVVIATGLGIFYILVGLCSTIVARERGAMIGGLTAVILLFSSQAALADGFLTHAVSHNISVVWGLLALLFATFWLNRRRLGWLLASSMCLLVGSLSDPWTDAAFLVPMFLASILVSATEKQKETRWSFIAVAFSTMIVGLLAHSKLLGVFAFLPSPPHQFMSLPVMRRNLVYMFRYIAVFFNVIPGLIVRRGQHASVIALMLDCGAFFLVTSICIFRLVRLFETISPRRRFLALTALFSFGVMAAALVLTGHIVAMVTTRYFANFFVFLPILAAAAPIGTPRAATMDAIGATLLGILFVVSGMISNKGYWSLSAPQVRLNGIPALAHFLAGHDLTYGYGPYWETEANAFEWVTRGKITIRPVNFDTAAGRFIPKNAQTLPLWYVPDGILNTPKHMFLIVMADGSTCGTHVACIAAARAQFGKASQILHYESFYILVYNHRIIPSSSNILGNYWKTPGKKFNWIGKGVEFFTGQTPINLTVSGRERPHALPPVGLSVNIDGHKHSYTIDRKTRVTIPVAPRSIVVLRAAKTFLPNRILHNGDVRHLSVSIAIEKSGVMTKP